ncbi:helix-turn-helix domain-containing protein [Shinella fusca]|uniref:Helix-turn-helix domain-containing protein n=1 Tax=Shinella fusca TaxID=544480 RepID=A0A7W7YXJ4_9HYPH|nr:helix-turn-helix domain-containing protein [Shinella fusca]MBB5044025.1 hypothetical protein [Shinella fusca]
MPAEVNRDIHLGFMAFGALADLTSNERRVAFAILDHYNKRDGRCDPSGERLAKLLEMDRTSVVKAVSRLCNVFGLFEKVSHGGHNHCASYRPQWRRYREIMGEWNAKARGRDPRSNMAKSPQATWRNHHTERGEITTQTDLINRIDKYGNSGRAAPSAEPPTDDLRQDQRSQARVETVNGLLRGSLKRVNGGRSPSHASVARQQAEKRLDADLISLGLHAHADAMNRMDEGTQADAVDAEMHRRGAGLALLQERLGLGGGRGPPDRGGGSKV